MNSYSLTYPISHTRLSLLRIPRLNFAAVWILCLLCAVALLGLYIFQINKMAESSYLIENYEKNLGELTQENKSLEINFAQLNSSENIESLVKNLNFEKVEKIHYIRILGGAVVVK